MRVVEELIFAFSTVCVESIGGPVVESYVECRSMDLHGVLRGRLAIWLCWEVFHHKV